MTFEELRASPIGEKLLTADYEIMNTGGGIMCWARQTAQEALIYIGQGDGDLGEDGNEENWGTCVTSRDGEYMQFFTIDGTLDHCIAEMAKLDATPDKLPADGARVRFRASGWEIFPEDVNVAPGERGTVVIDQHGGFGVRLDRHVENLAEWQNVVFLQPGDFAADNGTSETGWVLWHVDTIADDEDLYRCNRCEWHGSHATAAEAINLITTREGVEQRAGIMCPTCSSPLDPIKGITELTREYQSWTKAAGLPVLSADELLSEMRAREEGQAPNATEEQIAWVEDFLERWEAAVAAERTIRDARKPEASS